MSLFLDTDAQVSAFLADPSAVARRMACAVENTQLHLSDLYLIVGGNDFESGALTSPDLARREHLRRIFVAALSCASDLGVSGMTILPGLHWAAGDTRSWPVAVSELQWRLDQAAKRDVQLRIEPHLGSIVSTPELTSALIEQVQGLWLTLDAGHFVFQAIPLQRILSLAGCTGHVHLSGARPGGVHVRWKENEIDFPGFVSALQAGGFSGDYCVEYVPMDKWGADATDIISAIMTMRDVVLPIVC